jgi:hypothetical protein
MKKRLVIYHANCIDGFTAAWVAWLKFGDVATEYVAAKLASGNPAREGGRDGGR